MQSLIQSSIIGGALFLSGLASSAPVVECTVTFKFDSAVVKRSEVDACLKTLQLKADAKEQLEIIASATPEGTTTYNDVLSNKRAQNLQLALQRRVPSLKVTAKGVGEVPEHGLVARIVSEEPVMTEAQEVAKEVVVQKELTASVGISDAVTNTASEAGGRWRVGPRLGRDHARVEDKNSYFAPGIDVAYVPLTSVPNLRVEVGAIGNVYTDADVQRMNSFHFAPMVGYQSLSGMIAGVRGLVGVVNSDISNDSLDDSGAELRLGRETKNWSAFLGVGQTKVLDRIGLDLGYRF